MAFQWVLPVETGMKHSGVDSTDTGPHVASQWVLPVEPGMKCSAVAAQT